MNDEKVGIYTQVGSQGTVLQNLVTGEFIVNSEVSDHIQEVLEAYLRDIARPDGRYCLPSSLFDQTPMENDT